MNCSSAVPLKSAHGTPGVNTKRQDRHKQFIRVHRPVNETDDRALTDDEAETQTCRETWNCCALLSTICWCSLKMDGMRRNHWMVCALSLVCSGERAVWSTRKHSRVTESVNLCSSRFISEVFTWSTKAWVEVEVKKKHQQWWEFICEMTPRLRPWKQTGLNIDMKFHFRTLSSISLCVWDGTVSAVSAIFSSSPHSLWNRHVMSRI